jgi:hypothetical protein
MIARLTILPEKEFDSHAYKVKDIRKISTIERKWTDVVQIWDTKQSKELEVNVDRVSIYDHRLILNGEKHIILHMLSGALKVTPKPTIAYV